MDEEWIDIYAIGKTTTGQNRIFTEYNPESVREMNVCFSNPRCKQTNGTSSDDDACAKEKNHTLSNCNFVSQYVCIYNIQ